MGAEPWFKIGEAHGLRFLKEQLKGLEKLGTIASRATLLDLGCAEGLLGKHYIDSCGADVLHGLEVLPDRVEKARELLAGYDHGKFWTANLNDLAQVEKDMGADLLPKYDIVLCLAILHKLKDPTAVLRWAAAHCGKALAVRMPYAMDYFEDRRSGAKKFEPTKILAAEWRLGADGPGPRQERTLIYFRK